MHDLVEWRSGEGHPLAVRVSSADAVGHSYFSVRPDQWQRMMEIVREALKVAVGEECARGDGTGEP